MSPPPASTKARNRRISRSVSHSRFDRTTASKSRRVVAGSSDSPMTVGRKSDSLLAESVDRGAKARSRK